MQISRAVGKSPACWYPSHGTAHGKAWRHPEPLLATPAMVYTLRSKWSLSLRRLVVYLSTTSPIHCWRILLQMPSLHHQSSGRIKIPVHHPTGDTGYFQASVIGSGFIYVLLTPKIGRPHLAQVREKSVQLMGSARAKLRNPTNADQSRGRRRRFGTAATCPSQSQWAVQSWFNGKVNPRRY